MPRHFFALAKGAVDTLAPMRSKSLSSEQNQRARGLVRSLVDSSYESRTAAAKAFGVSQVMLSEFLNSHKGLGAKLLNGLSRVHPDVAAQIIGANIAKLERNRGEDSPLAPSLREHAIGSLTDEGYPYRHVKAALVGVAAYASELERAAEISAGDVAELARGLLEHDRAASAIVAARDASMGAAQTRVLRKSQEFAKGADGVRKRRASKQRE